MLVGGYVGLRLYRQLTFSVQVETAGGPAVNVRAPAIASDSAEAKAIAAQLRAAGLNETPVLNDTAISGHLARLAHGEVTVATLEQYAQNLIDLNKYTTARGTRIPTSFWDVRTPEMTATNWDEYWIVNQIAVPEAEPYLRFLADGYQRFNQFKVQEGSSTDTALDAALDLLLLADDYYASNVGPPPDDPQERAGYAHAKLMVWQSLVAGSTRTNPLTKQPLFSHSLYARNNIGTMYQHELGRVMGIAEVWGVTGFDPHFVGIAANNNQIEHLSISTLLQMVLNEPLVALNAIEQEKRLKGEATAAEAAADTALNQAIHDVLAPLYIQDSRAAVKQLRCFLKTNSRSGC